MQTRQTIVLGRNMLLGVLATRNLTNKYARMAIHAFGVVNLSASCRGLMIGQFSAFGFMQMHMCLTLQGFYHRCSAKHCLDNVLVAGDPSPPAGFTPTSLFLPP